MADEAGFKYTAYSEADKLKTRYDDGTRVAGKYHISVSGHFRVI